VDQKGQRQEIADEVFNVRADETPFTSLVPKDPKPAQKLSTWQTETYDDVDVDGVPDGEDVAAFSSQGREELTGVAQKFRKPWSVSDFADVTEVAGLPSGEKGRQKAVSAKKLKFALEGRFLSAHECAKQPAAAKNVTRGAYKWLDVAAQSLYPVPDAFRPASACVYSSTLAAFTEAAFEALVIAAYQAKRGKVDIDAFAGVLLQQVIDNFTCRDALGTTSLMPIRSFVQDGTKKAMVKSVTVLSLSYGTVRMHPSTFMRLDLAGAASAGTHRSMIGLDLSMWKAAFMRKPRLVELPDLGGGPRGFSDCIAILKSLNPLGQFKAEIDS
jgi:hypothetical protein